MDRFDTSKDPRFKRAPRNVRRVQVDSRFARMFQDRQFVEGPKVDARGQRLRKDASKRKLQEFYELAGVEGVKAPEEPEEGEEEPEEDELEEEEEEEEEEDEEDAKVSSAWETTQDVPQGDASSRLAVMGCDWDHVSAGDLMVMFRTYLSTARSKNQAGNVLKISVFPSDYGKQQLEREAREGPLLPAGREVEEDEAAQQDALRRYQMDRTKYYWAMVECDSVSTASWLYDQMDGLEADGVCPGTLDLRFVPEGLELPHEPIGMATEVPKKFAGPAQLRSATGHTKVKCTWDEAPAQRRKDLMRKRFTQQELAEMDLQAYLASSSEEEAEAKGKQTRAQELKALVACSEDEGDEGGAGGAGEGGSEGSGSESDFGTRKKQPEGDMEATFSMTATRLEEELSAKSGGVHSLQKESQSAWEKYLEKRKQKRRETRQKVKDEREKQKAKGDDFKPREEEEPEDLAVLMDESKDRGFNLRGPQRRAHDKGTVVEEGDNFQMDVQDQRISKVFQSADFEIDPTNPEFRKSDGMLEVLKEKRRRKAKVPKATPPDPAPEVRQSRAKAPEGRKAKASGEGLQIFASQKRALSEKERSGQAKAAPAKKGKKKQRKAIFT